MNRTFPEVPKQPYLYQNTFNYSVWTPNTEVNLCNVPWDASYRDVVRFNDDGERDRWFMKATQDEYSITLTGLVYLKYGEPIRINAPFDMVTNCNYIVVRNQLQPVPPDSANRTPDTFYYFITDAKYVAPNTTQINVQLDVWQTYYNRLFFNMCYVNRGHIGIANENSQTYNLSKYLTDPEGLNIGDEYEVASTEVISLQDEAPYIIVMSTANLAVDFGTVDSPNLATADGSINDAMPNGCSVYAFDAKNFIDLMGRLSNYPWVSQCISYVSVVPRVFATLGKHVTVAGVSGYELGDDPSVETGQQIFVTDLFDRYSIPNRYRHLYKLFTYPYTFCEMTAYNGGEIVLKNECIVNPDAGLRLNFRSVCTPPQVRGYVYPSQYNDNIDAPDSGDQRISYMAPNGKKYETIIENGEQFELSLQFTNFPQLAIVNNQYINYMASTANYRNYQFASADWSQNKALQAAQTAFNQAGMNISTNQRNQQALNANLSGMTDIGNELTKTKSNISQVKNIAGGGLDVLSALGSGNVFGALGSAASTTVDALMIEKELGATLDANNSRTALQLATNNSILQNNVANEQFAADTNLAYAQFAAKGDYAVAIQGIQAKVQDAKLTQPTTSGLNGGDTFNMSNGFCAVVLKFKRIKPNYMRQVGDFFLRYGYYVNRWMIPPADLKCMNNFTYWKMQEVSLSSSGVPETFKETVRGIFEKGVTVWSNPDIMYRIDLEDNNPVSGVRY